VIYTSGSTGQPKGVAMAQRPLLNLLDWQREAIIESSPQARTLQFAALGFDVAFQEIFSTLCAGGCLVLINEKVRQDPRALVTLVKEQRVERMFLPFIALQNFAEAAAQAGHALPALRTVVTAGEQLRNSPAIARLFDAVSGRRLHNHYGPTESHVVTAHTLDADSARWPALPPIGRPIANAQIHILDAHGLPAPIGVAGEIHIGGTCLANGYLNRPELTRERFADGLYKTGDLACWRVDGTIDYLGRNDFQIKIRGFRVELGEIEAKLATCTGVRGAAVLAREDRPGDKRLVAYVVADTPLSAVSLRAELAAQLPDYMVPGAFVQLDAFPLSPNGKLDRKALRAPDEAALALRSYVPPEGETETALAAIWQSLLGASQVGRDDDFFELGGHSLLALQMSVSLREQFDVDLPLRTLFERTTLAALGDAILDAQLAEYSDEDIASIKAELAALASADDRA
jgi:acyl-coenzyme A synthetase/AMP-(fatty) acid ligase/acyl carrier protein